MTADHFLFCSTTESECSMTLDKFECSQVLIEHPPPAALMAAFFGPPQRLSFFTVCKCTLLLFQFLNSILLVSVRIRIVVRPTFACTLQDSLPTRSKKKIYSSMYIYIYSLYIPYIYIFFFFATLGNRSCNVPANVGRTTIRIRTEITNNNN